MRVVNAHSLSALFETLIFRRRVLVICSVESIPTIHEYNTKTSTFSECRTKPVNLWAFTLPSLHANGQCCTLTQMFGEIRSEVMDWILLTGTIEWIRDLC